MSQPARIFGHRGLAAILLLAGLLCPFPASADDVARNPVDWDKQLGLVLHEGTSSLLPHESWHADGADQTRGGPPLPWLGLTPHIALVARDWGVSQVLWGHLAVTDQLRLSHSSRMVVTRLRLADGRVSPFTHVGVGQWRADTSVVPVLRSDVQLASQMGGGFEIEIAPSAVIALEADCTVLYHEGRDPQTVASGQLWSTLLAARARF